VLPRLFHVGNFSLPTYGLLVSIGVLVGLWISVRNSEKQGIDPELAWNFGILVVLAGIIGAKVLYILVDLSYYMAHPGEIFSFGTLQAGGVFSGGLVAGLVAGAWYIRKHHHCHSVSNDADCCQVF
jgi:phosphatidylglycerol---prolipoprotein diacylglyceryl transferase